MATVRFSNALVDKIIVNADNVFKAELEKARQPDPTWGDRIYNILMADYMHIVNQLPAKFFRLIKQIEVQPYTDNNEYKHIPAVYIELANDKPFPHAPEVLTNSVPIKAGFNYSNSVHISLLNDPRWFEIQQELLQHHLRIEAVQDKRHAFVEGVKKVIHAHSSLAPALKMWPPLWDLVPQDAKDKHLEKKERSGKTTLDVDELGVDLNQMTAAVVLKRITN